MTPLLVNPAGEVIYISGDGFINTPFLSCKFGNIIVPVLRYYNRTTISCQTPVVTDTSLDWTVYVTINGFEFKTFINVFTNLLQKLRFSAPITVYSIEPPIAFENE